MEQVLKAMLENVRAKSPLVHNITNYVTVNDVANVLLAAGGSPIMSDDADDVEDITSICGGLNINIGTLNKNTIPSMFLAGQEGQTRSATLSCSTPWARARAACAPTRPTGSCRRCALTPCAATSPRSRRSAPAAAAPRAWTPTRSTP